MINGNAVASGLLSGLRLLEYRGYDSAGVAIQNRRSVEIRRAVGSIDALADILARDPVDGPAGIGHTRWSTHGSANARNAHPHQASGVAVVHNGIIENHAVLREELQAMGVAFASDTDSEVIPHMLAAFRAQGLSPLDALLAVTGRLEGQFAIAALFETEAKALYVARQGSPLCLGAEPHAVMVASDALAFAGRAEQVLDLESGDVARVRRGRVDILDPRGGRVERRWRDAPARAVQVIGLNGHQHFMRKEIEEQPTALSATFAALRTPEAQQRIGAPLAGAAGYSLVACGTSHYAGIVARPWIERLTGRRVEIDIASEYRYRQRPVLENEVGLLISQSGETADTLACLTDMQQAGRMVAAVVNAPASTMAQKADVLIATEAGPEIGVASTKAFTAQLAALLAMAEAVGTRTGRMAEADGTSLASAIACLPSLVYQTMGCETACRKTAAAIADSKTAIFLGRGVGHGLALEGALKLKEISYIHAEGFAAGELKHGPIALIDETVPVIVVAPPDRLFAKTASNVEEVAARGGRIVLLSDEEGCARLSKHVRHPIVLPQTDEWTMPFVYVIALQFLAYHAALALGRNVDRPRNLAKSVTVE